MLIVFEGIDGSGKTTVINAVAKQLPGAICTSEFGRQEPWSTGSRVALMAAKTPSEEYEAIQVARTFHAREVLAPACERADVVLMDRYLMSTMAYQDSKFVPYPRILLDHFRLRFPKPDLVILLNVQVKTAMQRRAQRASADSFDRRPASFFQAVSEKLNRASFDLADLGWNIQPVNANEHIDDVIKAVMLRIETVLQGAPA